MTFAGAVGSARREKFPAAKTSPRCGQDSGATMAKRRTTAPQPARKAPAARPQNAQLNLQKRRVLTQHYRAKYGVK
jgi:hypothetical protein